MEIINCKDCVWYAHVSLIPEAEKLHNTLASTLGDVLPRREGEIGVYRKVAFSKDKPVLTMEDGFCHRTESKVCESAE